MAFGKSPSFDPSRYYTAGDVTISGSLTITGSLYIISGSISGSSGSYVMGSSPTTLNAISKWSNTTGDKLSDTKIIIDNRNYLLVPSGSIFGTSGSTSDYQQFTGSVFVSGNFTAGHDNTHWHIITGSTSISGSVQLGRDQTHFHQLTGSIYATGTNITLSGSTTYISGSNLRFNSNFTEITGSTSISGTNLRINSTFTGITGSTSISGSVQLGRDQTHFHQLTGSIYATGTNITLSGSTTYISGSNLRFNSNFTEITGSTNIFGTNLRVNSTFTGITGSTSISGSVQLGRDQTHFHQLTGSIYATGTNITLSGSTTYISGSNLRFNSNFTEITGSTNISGSSHRITGSTYVSGNIDAQGFNLLRLGTAPTGATGSYGLSSTHTGSALVISSARTNAAGNDSIRFIANVNNSTIDNNHYIAQFGWMSNGPEFTGSWAIKNNSIDALSASAAEILGTETNNSSSIGVILGTSSSYTVAGSKILSIRNAGTERENVGYDGTRTWGSDNFGGFVKDTYWTEIVSISGSNTYRTSNEIPAGALQYAAAVRVLTAFQTASVFSIGLTASVWNNAEWSKWGGGTLSGTAGVTNSTSSMAPSWVYHASGSTIWISCSVLQGNTSGATGSIRVQARYWQVGNLTL